MSSKTALPKKKPFPAPAIADNIIIDRIPILDVNQKRAAKGKLILAEGAPPKNLLDIEKKKMEDQVQYDNAERELLGRWDEHPNQGIIVSVGPGRDIGGGVLLTPSVKVGQHILIRGRAGEPFIVNKKLYWVIKEHEIFSTVIAADLIK